MTPQQYYARVFPQLRSSFAEFHYLVAAGDELLADGWSPDFLVAVEPVDQLAKFTLEKGMQVHLPVVARRSHSVLAPIDVEVFLLGDNHLLYTDQGAQRHWIGQTVPVLRYLEGLLRDRGIPYLLDYTPSGAHLLWHNVIGERATTAVEQIGHALEPDIVRACEYVDPNDIKRWWGISLPAARVFHGLGRLVEYLSLLTIAAFDDPERAGQLPVTISDSIDRCINLDNSWCEGSPFMRSIRSPFSLHKKNQQKHGMTHHPPLVDVVGTVFDGTCAHGEADIDEVVACMWDLERAAERAEQFTGLIPHSNDTMVDLVNEYRRSPLFEFHQQFDRTEELPRGAAVDRATCEPAATDHVRHVLSSPNPLALQPKNMLRVVRDLLVEANWPAKHIANLLRDLYIDPAHCWSTDFFKYPADQKASFWARTFSALTLLQTGRLTL